MRFETLPMHFNESEMHCKSILKSIFETLSMRWQTLSNAFNESATGRLESFSEPRLSQLSYGCCNLPFWLHFIHEIMAVKRLSATCVCFE